MGVAAAVVVVAAAAALTLLLRGTDEGTMFEVVDDRSAVTHEFTVPPGAAVRTARGEDLGIVPQRLRARVGDTIRIRNNDEVAATVGIFYVGPGDVVTMRFNSVGRLQGSCNVHPSGTFVIDVAP